MGKPFLVYGRPDCEDTQRARDYLDERGVTYEYIDINQDPEAEEFVVLYNSGEIITPTIVMGPDEHRTILVEPTNQQLGEALDAVGYENPRRDRRF